MVAKLTSHVTFEQRIGFAIQLNGFAAIEGRTRNKLVACLQINKNDVAVVGVNLGFHVKSFRLVGSPATEMRPRILSQARYFTGKGRISQCDNAILHRGNKKKAFFYNGLEQKYVAITT
jgi:hypothetical protein